MRQVQKSVILMLVVALFVVSPLWSGTTGKIAGTVIDKQSGDPLPGANVVIAGTMMGAASDVHGHYTILYIPPGTFNVEVSVIGYAKLLVKDVRVNIDQTSRVDAALTIEQIEVGEVTVVAERTVIKADVATSVVSVSADEVQELPIGNVESVVGLQAGVEDGLKIRGSEGDNALFMLDGVTMRDPRNNKPINRVALSAVKEINIERGGFNAEYGQVQSGIINVVTEEGSRDHYYGTITVKGSPPHAKYYRGDGIPDVQDPDSYWMRPYLDDEVCWTGTSNGAWDKYTRDKYPSFVGWNEISRQLLSNNNPDDDLTPLAAQRVFMYETRKKQTNDLADYEIDGGFGGPVPFISKKLGGLRFFTSYRKERDVLIWPLTRPDYQDYDYTLRLTSNINESMKLRFSSAVGHISTIEHNWAPSGFYPRWSSDIAGVAGGGMFEMFSDWAFCLADISHKAFAGKLTHTLNPSTFYEVSLEYIQRDYNTRPTELRNTSALTEIIPGYYRDENPFGYWPSTTDGLILGPGLAASLARDFSSSSATTFKADLTSQINFYNLVKAGVEFIYNYLDMDYGYIAMQTQGKTYASRVQMRNFPIRAAMYLQDKLETKGFTMNAGLRLDYANSRTDWWNFNPYDPLFISKKYSADRTFEFIDSKGQWQLSPRLGISHPITENSKLYFNYGHFKQMPQYETLFRFDRNASSELQRIGDPNLTLAKTISYELGYDHILVNDYLLQMAAFYRDISNQQNETQFHSINNDDYYLTTSSKYEDIRGFELTLRKSAGQWLSGFINYTYQVTSDGAFGGEEKYQDPSEQKKYDEDTANLYQEHPLPSPFARANLNFFSPQTFGPTVFGHHFLGGLGASVILKWNQGGWTTYNPKGAKGIKNNIQYVDDYDGTLRASKVFHVKKMRIQLLMDVGNMFNRIKLRDTGDQNYRLSLHLPKSEAYDAIPGDDKLGDYRKPGVEWQPMEYRYIVDRTLAASSERPIFYEGSTGDYWQYKDGQWNQVSQERIDKINSDKAYIDNSGPSTFWFLDPRSITFGARISFDLN
ncbi:TonB-dependent receptor [candidate division KSB1 bacterium]|nr:TonB-dependent receptor [candidate division KSB1 bacterium]